MVMVRTQNRRFTSGILILSTVLLVLSASQLLAGQPQNPDDCKVALQPTIEQTNTDYRSMQSYMSLHAAETYDRLNKLNKNELEADASYKLFSAEYSASNTSSEFKEKIEKRLQQEQFSSNMADVKSLSKQYLTNKQLDNWVECLKLISQRPQTVQLHPRNISKDGITLRIDIVMATGQASTLLDVTIKNGTIQENGTVQKDGTIKEDGTIHQYTHLVRMIEGGDAWSKSYLVNPSQGASDITIIAGVAAKNIPTKTDDITVKLEKPIQSNVSDFLDTKWFTHRAHISNVLDEDPLRKEYYVVLLKKASKYQAILKVVKPNPDATKHVEAFGPARTELFLADRIDSDPRRLSCTAEELVLAQKHIDYVRADPAANEKYTAFRATGLNKLNAVKAVQAASPDAMGWLSIVEQLQCFDALSNGLK